MRQELSQKIDINETRTVSKNCLKKFNPLMRQEPPPKCACPGSCYNNIKKITLI